MAQNKKNNLYPVKDCTPFSQDVNDDVLKILVRTNSDGKPLSKGDFL